MPTLLARFKYILLAQYQCGSAAKKWRKLGTRTSYNDENIFIFLFFLAQAEKVDNNVSEEASQLNERATFHCKVKSPDGAAELELWWQNKREENITNSDKIKVVIYKI